MSPTCSRRSAGGDLLVHHPYESFTGSVQRFIEQAAEDPDVLTIKMTLYRTSGDSPIVRALIDAAERGKQVVVMVELKARFDERANIVWARALERAGAHVAYGLVGLKTHCKAALVVRREGRGLRSYVHIGTGNYNPKTARIYTDLGLLSDDSSLVADVTDLFNVLTGVARKDRYRRLLVAPVSMRTGILDLIAAEAERQRSHGDGRIVFKVNSIVDPGVITALYRGEPGRRAHRPHRARHVLRGAGSAACQRDHRGALDRGPLPGALPDPRASARVSGSGSSSAPRT